MRRASGTPRRTLLVDAAVRRVRRPRDLVLLIASIAGIAVVLALAVYAQGTTRALTSDVQSVTADVVRTVLLVPLNVLEGAVAFGVPLAVVTERLVRGSWRSAFAALVTFLVSMGVAVLVRLLLTDLGGTPLTSGLSITVNGYTVVALNGYAAGLAGLLTMASARGRSRLTSVCWTLLWTVLVLTVIRGEITLPGALVTVLLGRACGLGARWLVGTTGDRAVGAELVSAVRVAGVDVVRLVRMDHLLTGSTVGAWYATSTSPVGYWERVRERRRPVAEDDGTVDTPVDTAADDEGPSGSPAPSGSRSDAASGSRSDAASDAAPDTGTPAATPAEPATTAPGTPSPGTTDEPWDEVTIEVGGTRDVLEPAPEIDTDALLAEVHSFAGTTLDRESVHRLYAARGADGVDHDVVVLDGDRQVGDLVLGVWDRVRRDGLDRRPVHSVADAAERAALLTYASRAAGVRAPRLRGQGRHPGSAVLVYEAIPGAQRFDELLDREIGDDLLDEIWYQVRLAHVAGISHLALSASSVVLDDEGRVWIRDWYDGEVASSEMSRRVDLAQVLALQAVHVGVDRALASAVRALSSNELAALVPLLQPVALPRRTRTSSGDLKGLLSGLREEIVALIPAADVDPVQLTRFSVRNLITAVVLVAAMWALLTSLNVEAVGDALRAANPWWMVAAFAVGLLTYLGGGITLAAFSPAGVRVGPATEAHLAAQIIGLVAPAGIGPAAVNLRFLQRHGIATPVAVATVALVQIFQFVVTVALLLVVAVVTGSTGRLGSPSEGMLWAIGITVAAVALVFAVATVRRWLLRRVRPTLDQAWPRVTWLLANPGRLTVGVGGVLLMTIAYVAAFGLALAAFGHSLPVTQLVLTYLLSSSAGAVVPTPGGIGPVEAALTGGLSIAGIPTAVAVSAAVVFRLVTFWLPVPLGWLALRHMQRKGTL